MGVINNNKPISEGTIKVKMVARECFFLVIVAAPASVFAVTLFAFKRIKIKSLPGLKVSITESAQGYFFWMNM